MATVKSNRQSYYPPMSPKPTAQEMALHLKNLYTATNDHDAAIDLLNTKIGTATTSMAAAINTSTIVTKTIIVSQFPGLGGVNDKTGLTAYTPTTSDNGILLLLGDVAAVTVTLNSAMTTPYFFFASNFGSSNVTLLPTSGSINQPTIDVGGFYMVVFDGTNWENTALFVTLNFADEEIPTGTINSINVTFTLAHTPSPPASLELFLAGLLQWQNASGDYTLSGSTITFLAAPVAGPLLAWYRF